MYKSRAFPLLGDTQACTHGFCSYVVPVLSIAALTHIGYGTLLIYWLKTNIIKKSTQPLGLLDASKETGLEVNVEKTSYMFTPRHQTAGQNHNIQTDNKPLEDVTKFKYCIHKEIESMLSSENACQHAVQSILSVRLSKTLQIKKVRKIIILSALLYGYEFSLSH